MVTNGGASSSKFLSVLEGMCRGRRLDPVTGSKPAMSLRMPSMCRHVNPNLGMCALNQAALCSLKRLDVHRCVSMLAPRAC